ncbi:MAG TPA: DNA translocase FtsK [Thermosulfurimonas dismutans]|uniref:DNA translocase FtsK n=1 Tax=Thermosulfurimonas dismutans TaxID=999894 RepID=A0A7C3H2D2_9BACT|nr:DNA translocase FtsK [Thermosulfurimonas dismutans]
MKKLPFNPWGLTLVVVGTFSGVALLSYRPQDPGWGHVGANHIHNWGGLAGAYLAGFLFNLLGFSAFLLVALVLLLGVRFLRRENFPRHALGGILALTLASSLGLSFVPESWGSRFRYPLNGGIIGFLFQHLRPYIGVPGLLILLFLTGAIGLGWMLGEFLLPSFSLKRPRLRGGPLHRRKKPPAKTDTPPEKQEAADTRPPLHIRGKGFPPPLDLLLSPPSDRMGPDKGDLEALGQTLEEKLREFGVEGKVCGINPGPVITVYEFKPAPGIKINRIVSLADDLALGLSAESVRIVAPIPGKDVVGIEVSNPRRETVYLREILESEAFRKSRSPLTLALGKDQSGHPVVADLARMPHLLIAGATGTGKSVFIHSVILSLIYKNTPERVRFLLIDPKRIELSTYEDIPYLLHPVVLEPKLATRALRWAVEEMERRYTLLEESRTRNLDTYNRQAEEKLPYIVIIIDELADLMVVSSKEVETLLTRLAQMARASGIHLLLATQRPSVDVITGLIKANFPARLSFQVSSRTDSRTILDVQGAERLLGAGDMLFLPPGASKLRRIHAPYVSESEVQQVVEYLRAQGAPEYLADFEALTEGEEGLEQDLEEEDELYRQAVEIAVQQGKISVSMLQRRLRIGYNRAARLVERMEKEGIVGPSDGVRPRPVLSGRKP